MTSRAGVLVSVHWGQQQLATEFLPLRTPRDFTVGSEAGCDFAFGGARRFGLVAIDADGAAFRAPEKAVLRKSRDGDEVVDGQAHRVQLDRGDSAEFDWGPLCFSARLLDAPPPARSLGFTDFTTVNVALVLVACFGLFAVAAANRDAEGDDLDDGVGSSKTRLIKSVLARELPKPTAASAASESSAPKADRVKPAPGRQARRVDVRPQRPAPSAKDEVAALFGGPGISGVFANGNLGNELRAAASGLQTVNAGTGLDGLGGGYQGNAGGLGGMGPDGIGALGTKGGRGAGAKGDSRARRGLPVLLRVVAQSLPEARGQGLDAVLDRPVGPGLGGRRCPVDREQRRARGVRRLPHPPAPVPSPEVGRAGGGDLPLRLQAGRALRRRVR
jgi:hypothetical protein